MAIALFIVGLIIGWFVGSRHEGLYKSAVKKLTETVLRLDNEEKVISQKIQKGDFKGKRLAERKDVARTYKQKIQCYIWCLINLGYYEGKIKEIWKKRRSDYSDDYSAVFKKKKYCKKCGSLY